MPETTSLANVKAKLSSYVDTVYGTHDRVTITRNGEPVAVLISPAELESIDATLEVLSDPMFNLAEFLAESGHADAHPEENVTAAELGAAYEHRRQTGSWPEGVADLTYQVIVDRHAMRGFARLPEKVQAAVWELINGVLTENPRRVGSALLDPPLRGVHRAKRGEFVLLYVVDEEEQTVHVRRIEHRRTAYARPLPE